MFWLILGLILGWYARDIRAQLKRIGETMKGWREPDVPQKKSGMSFGEPSKPEEMSDEEYIESLNKM